MGNFRTLAAALPILAASALTPALAGPCADQIQDISRMLSAHPTVAGAPTTGTLNGAVPNGASKSMAGPGNPSGNAGAVAQSNGTHLTGEGATKQMNAAAANVATSPDDVRRQQAGVPTMADAPNVKTPDQRIASAQMQLDKARQLDARGDPACREAANQASELAKQD